MQIGFCFVLLYPFHCNQIRTNENKFNFRKFDHSNAKFLVNFVINEILRIILNILIVFERRMAVVTVRAVAFQEYICNKYELVQVIILDRVPLTCRT